ncbi:hypothetical protein DNTS_005580 [Danionella cerebrum]|uniref:WAS/WASL-interacting protein family member 3 n=1 Tax=Danionella cerebrum TaxID=2873325 RepID=A0A553NJZ2_9TELE|nr:hypothetical protein DNTS_005580 [Danionella translucida]
MDDRDKTIGCASQTASAVAPSLGGLFAGGFPVLKPVGQRDKRPHHNPVSRSGSSASLKQPLWNPPSQGDGFRGSAPDLSPSHRSIERTASLSKARPASSYTAPPSPSQNTHPTFKLSSTPPSSAPPPPPPPHQERPMNKPPPLPTCPPPPPPPHLAKPTWLPVQSHFIPMPTTPPPPLPPSIPQSSLPDRSSGVFYPPPPPPPPSVPPSCLPDKSSGVFYPPPPPFPSSHSSSIYNQLSGVFYSLPSSPGLIEIKEIPPPPPPLPASFASSQPTSAPPTTPQKVPHVPSQTFKTCVQSLPPSYPCSAPSRRPPAVPRFAGAPRMAPPPAPPARSPNTELSCRIPPPPPPPPVFALPSSVRNGQLHSLVQRGFYVCFTDDFESKFHFHPIEDFPPPEEFRPFPRIYPSKENREMFDALFSEAREGFSFQFRPRAINQNALRMPQKWEVNPQPPATRTHLR